MSASFPRGQKESSGNEKKSLKRSAVVESAPFGKKRSKVVEVVKNNGSNKGASSVVVPSIGLGLVGDQKLQKVDMMSFGKLSTGCIVLGYVLQVDEKHLLVSLPGGFTGIVPYNEVSDVIHEVVANNANNSKASTPSLSSLVKTHQVVRCFILGQIEKANSKKKTITLSMRSSLINKGLAMKHFIPGFPISGCIASKEDHGYTVSTGVPSVNGFLLFKDIPTAQRDMVVGQPVECITATVNEGARSISLRVSKKATMGSVIQGSSLTFNSLNAGMLVNAVVADKVKNGIILSFLGLFRGMVDTTAMPQGRMDSLTAGDVVQARIIFIDHANKIVRLSMNHHILELRTPSELPALGSLIDNVQVVSILKKSGVLLAPTAQLEAGEEDEGEEGGDKKKQKPDTTLIFVHKKSLADLKEEREDADADTLLGTYRVKTEIDQVRVKGYNLVEGWIVASNEQKFLEQKVLHSTDLTPGQLVDVEIGSVRDFGLVVKLAKGLTAICPTMHTSDIVVDGKVKKTLKVGQKHTMRVWELDGKAVVMTNKKSLLDLKPEALIKSLDDATVGKVSTGLISKINLKTGLTVRFFNKVKGVIPLNILAKQGVLELESSFRIGQIVKVVVIQKNELEGGKQQNNGKSVLVLGLDLNVSPAAVIALLEDATASEDNKESSADGSSNDLTFVSGTVSKLTEDSVNVVLDDGRPAKIHRHHLFDFAATADQVFANENHQFQVGFKITKALILSEFKGLLNLTCKPLLLNAAEKLQSKTNSKKNKKSTSDILAGNEEGIFPRVSSELVPGKTVVGFVSKVESYGVFVRFRDNLSALAPRVNISDKFVNSAEGRFNVGDSIRCVVQRVDLVKERTLLTLKSSIVTAASGKANFLSASLSEACVAARAVKPTISALESFLQSNPLSSVVKAKVVSVQEYGIVLSASDNSTVIHVKNSGASTGVSVGSSVKVVLIDVDYATCAVSAILHSDLQTHAKVKAFTKSSGASSGATSAIILAKRDTHLIVVTSAGVFGYCMVADFHNPKPDMAEYNEHSTIQVSLIQATSEGSYPHASVPLYMLSGENDVHRSVAALVQKDAEESDLRLQKRLSGNKEDDSGADSAALRQKFIESLRVGYLTKWIVSDVTPYEVSLLPEHSEVLNMSIKAKIHVSSAISPFHPSDELRKNLEAVPDHATNEIHDRHPFHGYKKGALIWCYVLQVRRQTASGADANSDQDEFTVYCAKTFKTSESSEGNSRGKQSSGSSEYVPFSKMPQSHGKDAIKCPSVVAGAVTKITSMGCVVSFSPYLSAHINFLDISADSRLVALFSEKCYIGLKVVVLVTKLPVQGKEMMITRADIEPYLNETSNPSDLLKDKDVLNEVQAKMKQPTEYKVGQLVTGILNLKNHHLPKPPAVMVGLKGSKFGRVCVTELSDVKHWQDLSGVFANQNDKDADDLTLPDGRSHGSVVECRVLAVNDKYLDLSLRKSRVADKKAQRATAPDAVPEEGSIVQGYVANVSKKGCFVRLSQGVTGQVMMKDISEEFVEDPEAKFPVGKLVSARVLSINQVDSMARLSFKLSSSKDSGNGSGMTAAAAGISEGDTLTGVVQRITDFGVFITLKDSGIVGLSRKAAALSNMNKSLEEEYSVGDTVRAKVLSVSANTQKIALGLTEHYFRHDDGENGESESEEMDEDEDEEDAEEGSDMDVDEEEEEEEEVAPAPVRKANKEFVFSKSVLNSRNAQEEDSDEESENDSDNDDDDDDTPARDGSNGGGLMWDDFDLSQSQTNAADSAESDVEEKGKDGKGLRTRQKEAAQRSAEQMTYQREAALLDGTAAPKTVEDFDRLLIAQPNSSYLWVRLIAFHLEKADVLSARNVATRALKTINFREENEKFNVWIAWLNLEHKYGTMESLTQVFDRAVNESKGKYIFLALADVYEKAGDYNGAEAIFQKALKRPQYKKSKKVWSAFHLLKLRSGDVKGAKEQFSRSLQSLSKHKHIEVISKYALAEFEVGSPDRGRVVFEDLLNTYPKRTDLWHLYVDREVKLGNVQQARQLFERMIHSTLSARNMKTVFKKYLTFESQYGDESSQDAVKQKAREYVSNLA